jgi:hypothetical protein
MVRRGSTWFALIGLLILALPAAAVAAPAITLVAKAVPIPGFPGTDDRRRARRGGSR